MSTDPLRPIDPDVDLRDPAQRRELARSGVPVIAAIALGGGAGAIARHGIAELFPADAGHFPWGTFAVNVVGSLFIGALMVLITEVRPIHPLTRPFLGVGFLGGFTTFSTYAVETQQLLQQKMVGTAISYAAGTLVCAIFAVIVGVWLTRTLAGVHRRTSS